MEKDFVNHPSNVASMPSNELNMPNMRSNPSLTTSAGPSMDSSAPGPSHLHNMGNPACLGNRILSRNCNGTIAMTSQPTNESELQLYRVLQRANLLSYYDTFICQGGDDVQQLCEAGEEEFLEIMALVGMASKPLHVRRLQKALQEWVSNPGMFQAPLMPPFPTNVGPATGAGGPLPPPLPPPPSSMSQIVPGPPGLVGLGPSRRSPVNLSSQTSPVAMRPSPPSVGGFPLHPSSSTAAAAAAAAVAAAVTSLNSTHCTPSPTSAKDHLMSPTHSSVLNHSLNNGQPNNMGTLGPSANNGCTNLGSSSSSSINCNTNTGNNSLNNINSVTNSNGSCSGGSSASGLGLITNEYGQPASPVSLTPILMENQIQRLAEAAEMLVKSLMPMDPKFASNKKRISKELEYVMNMPEDDPRRLDEIRKYAAIYGRFDCKRKPEKPLTLHEVSVNEAAAQICKHIPALLTRRDELFPLARQVVRDSGYQYSKGHSRSQIYQRQYDGTNAGSGSEGDPSNPNGNSHNKRIRIGDNQLDFGKMNKYHNGMARGYNRIPSLCDDKGDTDDNDSQFSLYSNTSSPSISQDQRGDSPTKESSQNSSDFSKLIPAKKTNNTSAATQLTRQLVQETLTEEGLRMVNEYMNQNKHEDIGVDLRVAVSEKISEPSLMPPTSLPATTGFSGCMP